MQRLYLALALVGFAIPIAQTPAMLEHLDNFILITKPAETVELAFANYVSTAFSADLLWVFVVFCIWVVAESRSLGIPHYWVFILLTFFFGVCGPFALFLYWRQRQITRVAVPSAS